MKRPEWWLREQIAKLNRNRFGKNLSVSNLPISYVYPMNPEIESKKPEVKDDESGGSKPLSFGKSGKKCGSSLGIYHAKKATEKMGGKLSIVSRRGSKGK